MTGGAGNRDTVTSLLAESGERTASVWQIHAGHLIMLAGWIVVFGVGYLRSWLRSRGSDEPATAPDRRWAAAAAVTGVVAGAVHLTVIGEHFAESWLYGSFFLVLTVMQVGWAAAVLWRPSRSLLLAGAAASVLVALLWLATRTIGIPVGPGAGETEPFGTADTLCSITELLTAALVLLAVRRPQALRLRPLVSQR